ncbi:hypothetical protein VTH06DRAFT_683 [Thermothelomyces fergusii]
MEVSCQCKAVSFKTPLPKPLALYICHCHDCQRQSSSAFGMSAIFPSFPLPDAGLLSCYNYFCKGCGTRLIHTISGKKFVSVKGGCIEGLDWESAIHIWTRSAMVPIPEGVEAYPDFPPIGPQEISDQPPELIG